MLSASPEPANGSVAVGQVSRQACEPHHAPRGNSPASGSRATPRLSVIIPVRNDPIRLKRCLQSLAASTFRDFEVIVADDASTDHTADVAAAVGARVVRLSENSGAAAARNAAAATARGTLLLFVDADVLVRRDSLQIIMDALDDPLVDAVFGSYDLEPEQRNLLSQYKNLAHRYYHQSARGRASTFWTGCGAIRREVFRAAGGFDAQQFTRPTIEDIELGARLTRAGRVILNDHRLEVTHLKRWSFSGILKSDIFDRAIPWTRLTVQTRDVPDDLNLAMSQRVSALLAAAFVAIYLTACWYLPWLALLPVGLYLTIASADNWTTHRAVSRALRFATGTAILLGIGLLGWYATWWALALALPLLAIICINSRFYRFFAHHRGWLFTCAVLPMHLLYYLYGGAVFVLGTLVYRFWIPATERAPAPQLVQSSDVCSSS